MQQGNCNAPSTFQRFMVYIFRDYVGRFIHVFLDNIFIFSMCLEDHERHLALVFECLCINHLYLSAKKVNLYSICMDCLRFIINNNGILVGSNKMQLITSWHTPRNYHDVQRFLGLVQYLAQFMPNVTAYTTPLSGMARHNMLFIWTPVLDKCFESIKTLILKTSILKPIDPSQPETIWLVCDASASGIGTFYSQGPEWYKAHPVGFMSKKFTPAQCNYHTWEHELIPILESLMKWEDKLFRHRFVIVTDHKALRFFKMKMYMSDRQVRWWEFLSQFNYTLVYTKGSANKVADALSHYYISDRSSEQQEAHVYANIDAHLDPDGDYIMENHRDELKLGFLTIEANAVRRSTRNQTKSVVQPETSVEEPIV